MSGCATEPEALAARHAAERYLAALTAHDQGKARAMSSCPGGAAALRGATLLRVGALESMAAEVLDSLATEAALRSSKASVELLGADEESADSLARRAERAERRARMFRDAFRAVEMSRAGAPGGRSAPRPGGSALLLCRCSVRVRWGGPLVGPEAVDREAVLRELAVPGGRWIVYSFTPRDRDPGPVPARARPDLTRAVG